MKQQEDLLDAEKGNRKKEYEKRIAIMQNEYQDKKKRLNEERSLNMEIKKRKHLERMEILNLEKLILKKQLNQ